jgi:hypothetical protein
MELLPLPVPPFTATNTVCRRHRVIEGAAESRKSKILSKVAKENIMVCRTREKE